MKRIDLGKLILYILVIICVCFLKKNYIYAISNDDGISFVKVVLAYWGSNQLVNLIWFLPIIFDIYVLSKKYFYRLIHFDLRYKNRRKYINFSLLSFIIESLLFVLLSVFCQLIIISLFMKNIFIGNFNDLFFILQFVIENVFLIVTIVLFSLIIKRLMYSLISIIIINFIILTSAINLSLISSQVYLPFINIYFGNNNYFITASIVLFEIIIIKKIYLHCDIGGME